MDNWEKAVMITFMVTFVALTTFICVITYLAITRPEVLS